MKPAPRPALLLLPSLARLAARLLAPGFLLLGCHLLTAAPGIEPGSIWREHIVRMDGGKDWRVTDPDARWETADQFLPNTVFEIGDVSLANAVRAELVIDYWSGHPGTTDKKVRFNRDEWLPLPPGIEGAGRPDYEVAQTNLRIEVPLDHLVEGSNTLQGSCGDNDWGWGQWGWYAAKLRIFYAPATVAFPLVSIELPESAPLLPENPVLGLSGNTSQLAEARLIGRYYGIDEDGDGVFNDFHGMFRKEGFEGHLGTLTEAPWELTWDTRWVPDQEPGSIAIQAHVRSRDGFWSATGIADGLSLDRKDRRVELYTQTWAHTPLWVRNNGFKSAVMRIPQDETLSEAGEAVLYLRLWNGENGKPGGHTPTKINAGPWIESVTGQGHYFDSGFFAIDPAWLQTGDNLISFRSADKHHGSEILWPGPQVLVSFAKPADESSSPVPPAEK